MCSLKSEPWRANFTGPKCRCGVPTAGTPAERFIEMEEREKARKAELEDSPNHLQQKYPDLIIPNSAKEHAKNAIAEERERRIDELFKKYRGW